MSPLELVGVSFRGAEDDVYQSFVDYAFDEAQPDLDSLLSC